MVLSSGFPGQGLSLTVEYLVVDPGQQADIRLRLTGSLSQGGGPGQQQYYAPLGPCVLGDLGKTKFDELHEPVWSRGLGGMCWTVS